jgi:MOSC domain-containing protein YiiM
LGIVEAICIGAFKDKPKEPVSEALFLPGGIEGDCHLGTKGREVSLLLSSDVAVAEDRGKIKFPPGSLAENLRIKLDCPSLIKIGSKLRLGENVILEVVERGKRPDEPHTYSYMGWCLLPDVGYFLKVVFGGRVRVKDEVKIE